MQDLKPSQAPSIKPPHLRWKRLSKELSLGFNENQMLWAQLSCFLSRATEQPLLQFHQEPCPSFPSSSAPLSSPNQNQIKSSWPKLRSPPQILLFVLANCLWISKSGSCWDSHCAWDTIFKLPLLHKSGFTHSLSNVIYNVGTRARRITRKEMCVPSIGTELWPISVT